MIYVAPEIMLVVVLIAFIAFLCAIPTDSNIAFISISIMIVACLLGVFAVCEYVSLNEKNNTANIKDYSKSELLTYNKITLEENKNDSSDTFYYVYLDNGEKYKIDDNIKVMVNTDQLSDCFIPAGTEYIIRNNLAYIYNRVEKDTLYVNQETYNIITSSPNYKTTIIE